MNKETRIPPIVFAFFVMITVPLLFSCAATPTAREPVATKAENVQKAEHAAVGKEAPAIEEPVEEGFSAYAFAQGLSMLLDAGDFAGAIASFDDLEEPEASSPEILKLKLSILISSGDIKEASKLAKTLESKLGEDVDVLHARAVIALAENNPKDRDKYLRQIVKIDPRNTEALISLGDDARMRKAYGDAARWYAQAVAADSGNAAAHQGLVHSYYIQGRMKDARAAVNRALALHPDDASLIVESALIYAEENKLPAALDEMRRALALAPDVSSYWSTYGVMLVRASNLEDAREALSNAIRIDPNNTFSYIYRCGVNDTLGFVDEAIADYRVVCKNYPQYYFAAEGLGTLLWIRGDYEGARHSFARAFKYNDDSFSYALMYTICSYKLGEKDEAKRFIGKFMNTLKDRTSPEYYVCRLFYDLSGDADVVSRVARVSDAVQKDQLMFYVAAYYEIFRSEAIANKFYSDIAAGQEPACFEQRLAAAAAEKASAQSDVSRKTESAR